MIDSDSAGDAQSAVPRIVGFAEVNGTRLWFEEADAGPPLVLIHGSPLDARMWDAQITPFAARNRVIRYDVRGYGRSALPGDIPYRHEDDLAALLTFLGIDRAALLGLSMGGRLAIDFALAYPAAVSALVLAGSSLSGFPWSVDATSSATEVADTWREAGAAAAKQLVLGRHWFKTARPQPEVTRQLEQIIGDYSGWHWLHEDPVLAPNPPAYERVEAITAPALIILGEEDHADIHATAAALTTRIPGAQCEIIPGAGHMVNLEQPAHFNESVIAFLAGLSENSRLAEDRAIR